MAYKLFILKKIVPFFSHNKLIVRSKTDFESDTMIEYKTIGVRKKVRQL